MSFVLSPIRSDNAYYGFSKETVPGSPVAPSVFPRWMDGSTIEIDMTAENVLEGDGSRRLSLIVKNRQMVKIKLSFTPRSNEAGFFEAAAMGAGSDTYTAPAVSTILSSNVLAGATSIPVTNNTGLTGSGTIPLVLGQGSATEEVATFNLPVTGSSVPYTLTVASGYNGGALKYSHSAAFGVQTSATHVLTDQTDGNYYTIEVGLGSLFGANGTTLRVRSCKCDTFKRSSKAGSILTYEAEFIGIACAVQSTPATVTLEQRQPFLFTQAIGTWAIDGSTTSVDAQAIEAWDIEQKNNVDTGIQTEALTLAGLIFGMLDVGIGYDLVFTNASKIYQTYFGSPTGTVDAQALGLGSFAVTFTQPDGFQSITYTINTVAYTKTPLPAPKKDGKHYKLQISGTSIASSGGPGAGNAYLLQTTITNMQYSAY